MRAVERRTARSWGLLLLCAAGLLLGMVTGASAGPGTVAAVAYPAQSAVDCANGIMGDLDAAAEGDAYVQVPSPRYDWVLLACENLGTDTSSDGVYGSIYAGEDGSYVIQGYGDRYASCVAGKACDDSL